MIRVYRMEGASRALLDLLETNDPVEAETHYLRLSLVRTPRRGWVIVDPGGAADVPPADYETMADVADEGREREHVRAAMMWRRPDNGWTGPTPSQLRAALALAGLSQTAAAHRLGITPRTMRYWCAGDKRPDWAAWAALLAWCGHRWPVGCPNG